jgi:hypothetical protein
VARTTAAATEAAAARHRAAGRRGRCGDKLREADVVTTRTIIKYMATMRDMQLSGGGPCSARNLMIAVEAMAVTIGARIWSNHLDARTSRAGEAPMMEDNLVVIVSSMP